MPNAAKEKKKEGEERANTTLIDFTQDDCLLERREGRGGGGVGSRLPAFPAFVPQRRLLGGLGKKGRAADFARIAHSLVSSPGRDSIERRREGAQRVISQFFYVLPDTSSPLRESAAEKEEETRGGKRVPVRRPLPAAGHCRDALIKREKKKQRGGGKDSYDSNA